MPDLTPIPVFEEYTAAIEKLIESELERRIDGFDMEAFLEELAGRREKAEMGKIII